MISMKNCPTALCGVRDTNSLLTFAVVRARLPDVTVPSHGVTDTELGSPVVLSDCKDCAAWLVTRELRVERGTQTAKGSPR